MDRKSLIILLVSALLLAAWYPLSQKIFPPIPARPRTNALATPSNSTSPAMRAEAQALTPETTPLTSPSPNPPPREERTLTLDSQDATYVFTSIGGGFKQIALKHFKAAV